MSHYRGYVSSGYNYFCIICMYNFNQEIMTNTKAKTAIDVIRNLRVKQADRMILYFHLTLRGSYCVLTARRVVFGPRV